MPLKIVCISDTHSLHKSLVMPEGDILVHTGDMSKRGRMEELLDFNFWLGSLPYRHKIMIAGNHDFGFERDPEGARALITNAIYLKDSGVVIKGLYFWGSPWQPRFFDWAFNLDRGEPLKKVWSRIPAKTDVLLTHGPPAGILDTTLGGQQVGCADLREAVLKIRPKLHVFGHIHEAYGIQEQDGIRFINASSCNLRYQPVQPPIVVEV